MIEYVPPGVVNYIEIAHKAARDRGQSGPPKINGGRMKSSDNGSLPAMEVTEIGSVERWVNVMRSYSTEL